MRIRNAILAKRRAQSKVCDQGEVLLRACATTMVEKTSAIEIQRESAINKAVHSSAAHNHHVKGWKLDVVVRERSEVITRYV